MEVQGSRQSLVKSNFKLARQPTGELDFPPARGDNDERYWPHEVIFKAVYLSDGKIPNVGLHLHFALIASMAEN